MFLYDCSNNLSKHFSMYCSALYTGTIIDNIKVNKKTQIGAGTVVINSIEKSGLYVGNPAKFVR